MKTLAEIQKRIELRRKKLKDGLMDIVQQLKEMGAVKIILFGSFVSDNIRPASDLDILVIMPNSKSGKEWLREVYTEVERKVASDILVFNLREYEEEDDKNFLLREVARKGKVIYEKEV